MIVINNNVVALVDWFTFTIKNVNDSIFVINEVLKLTGLTWLDSYGFHGYKKAKKYCDISVMYDGDIGMGVCISMSGQGCREFETFSAISFLELFAFCLNDKENINITRIDIALDEKSELLNIKTISNKIMDNDVNSRFQNFKIETSIKKKQSAISCRLGSETSEVFIRIYDKAKERGDYINHWIRVELQIRRQHAQAMVEHIMHDVSSDGEIQIGNVACAVLNRSFQFIERDNVRVERCTISPWWTEFLNTVNSIRLLTRCDVDYNILRANRWVDKQVSATLSMIHQCEGINGILKHLSHGSYKLNAKQQHVIDDYKEKHKLEFDGHKQVFDFKQLAIIDELGWNYDTGEVND